MQLTHNFTDNCVDQTGFDFCFGHEVSKCHGVLGPFEPAGPFSPFGLKHMFLSSPVVPISSCLNPVSQTCFRPKSETKTVLSFNNSHGVRQSPKPENILACLYHARPEQRISRAGSSTLRASIAKQKEQINFQSSMLEETPLFSSETNADMFEIRDCDEGQICVKWNLPAESGHYRFALRLKGFQDCGDLFSTIVSSEYRAFTL